MERFILGVNVQQKSENFWKFEAIDLTNWILEPNLKEKPSF